ncbi:hypothetical protein BGX34_010541 [Mortierella sp. NVP85]|nr:hypothetical protein BGX34_010541 [Mortierella sp. NVP85]
MVFSSAIPSHLRSLSLKQALELSNLYLENAYRTTDRDIVLVLCHDAKVTLSQAKSANKKYTAHPNDAGHQALREGIVTAYIDLGKLFEKHGRNDEAQSVRKMAEKWGGNIHNPGRLAQALPPKSTMQQLNSTAGGSQGIGSTNQPIQHRNTAIIPAHIFANNVPPSTIEFRLPQIDERLMSTPQLAYCLSIMQASKSSHDQFEPEVQEWLHAIESDTDEQERLQTLVTDVVRAFKRDELKDAKAIAEVVYLAPILTKDTFQDLLREFYIGIDQSGLLNTLHLEGLAQLIQGADPGYLDADDLVKILDLLSTRLKDTHGQSTHHMYQLTLAVSHILDAMTETNVTGLDREKLHQPLLAYLSDLKGSKDPYLVYQSAYASQALLCVPDNETTWQSAMRRTGKVIQGVSGIVSAVKSLDLIKFIEGLQDIQRGCEGASKVVNAVTSAYVSGTSLAESGKSVLECLTESFSSKSKMAWYSALRGADALIRDGELATFRQLVCETPCRLDIAFQWGVCQRLGEMAANPAWDMDARRDAVLFLGEVYKDDEGWGHQASIKQWTLNILMQLALVKENGLQFAETLLQELGACGDDKKQALYRACRENGPISYPLKVTQPELTSPSLLDRVQDKQDIEHNLRRLKNQRTKERACPTIEKPEHDLISKQLRRSDFTELQIREMKRHRKLILICDGYDESQSTHNLYMSNRLNQPGEWDAQMMISCRSEYLGSDYRDRFQPGNRNRLFDSPLFQKAVMVPFSIDQVQAYIKQYVSLHQSLWREEDYKQALELIPSLNELARNPFLMTLSLEVLPRTVDPRQLSTTRITRMELYGHFIEHWLERGKKRLAEKDLSPRMREAFEKLNVEGFTQSGIEYLKKLAVAIYKEQDGHPVVEYTQRKDEGSWKDSFFGCDDKQLLLESCPLTRNGSQHRFIHQTILEYGLACAISDIADKRNILVSASASSRRKSVSSTLSFEMEDTCQEEASVIEPDPNSPLAWRSFVSDHSLMQFLEERVRQEPIFKEQLHAYIEHSKKDKKWRRAAANSITILVRAGVQFNGADLCGIQIPGADLSYGQFDSARLQGADLRKVNLRGVWMRQADLSRAQMTGVQFDELPCLMENEMVFSCMYSPDGKALAIGLYRGTISVYTTSDWEKVMTLTGHTGAVFSVVYSPRGDQIASCSRDETVRLWDVKSGDCKHILTGHTHNVNGVAYSPQGDRVASSGDRTIRIWDSVTGECLQTLFGHGSTVNSIAYAPNGKQVVSGSFDTNIRLWNIETGDCIHIFSGHINPVSAVAFSPKGDQVVSSSADGTIRIWDVGTGRCCRVLTGDFVQITVSYSPSGNQVASGGRDGVVHVWDVQTGLCCHTFSAHNAPVASVTYSPSGDQIASSSIDRTVRLWDVTAKASRFVSSGHTVTVYGIKFVPEEDLIVTCSIDRTVRLWDAGTGVCRRIMRGHIDMVLSVAYSPQDRQIATGGADKSICLWDMETERYTFCLTGHTGIVSKVAYHPRGGQVASGSHDMTVRLWETTCGDCQGILSGHMDAVRGIAYSPNGKWIASGSGDCTVRIWDVESFECQHILILHANAVWDVAFSPDGCQLASAGEDNIVQIWNMENGERLLTLTDHHDCVFCIAYSPQGGLLASGSDDKTVRLWDVASGECRAVIPNFQDAVQGIDWGIMQGGTYLVTSSKDGSVLNFQVIYEVDQLNVRLKWCTMRGTLNAAGASIQDVSGLARVNRQLLRQCGAVGELEIRLNRA